MSEGGFAFKDVDHEGMETLDVIGKAPLFNRWMFDTVKKHLSGKVLEIGSGTGNISGFFIAAKWNITLSDIRESYCSRLRLTFPGSPVLQMDLTDPAFNEKYGMLAGAFDSLFALNVIEHIEDDALAVRNAAKLLRPGGNIVILVPAYRWLYNGFDKELRHYRRYTLRRLSHLVSANGFRVSSGAYFNLFGILGWFLTGTVLRRKMIPEGQMKIYDRLVPVIRILDAFIGRRAGLSVIVAGKRM